MNLFVTTHEARHETDFDRPGTDWENTFTEQLAFSLSCDPEGLEAFSRALLGEQSEPVRDIDVLCSPGSNNLYLSLELASGAVLLVESEVGDTLAPGQLERYIDLIDAAEPSRWLAIFADSELPVPTSLRSSRRYLSPADQANFRWHQLFDWLPEPGPELGTARLRRHFKQYMELLGFARSCLPGGWSKLLGDRRSAAARETQEAFSARLVEVKDWLLDQDFRVSRLSRSALRAAPLRKPWTSCAFHHVEVKPGRALKPRMSPAAASEIANEVLKVCLIYDAPRIPTTALELDALLPRPFVDSAGHRWFATYPFRSPQRQVRQELVTDLDAFLGEHDQAAADQLCRAVSDLLDQVRALTPAGG